MLPGPLLRVARGNDYTVRYVHDRERRRMARRNIGQLNFGAIERLRLGWRLLRDPRIPAWPKLLVPLAALYIISPIDFIPDFLLVIGQVDDISVIGLTLAVIAMLVRWSPPEIVAEHAADLGFIPHYDGAKAAPGSATGRGEQQEPIEATYWVDEWR
jgi:uncharacterized membrane protein YkvA (DUF1232 family)